jgi:hypothetical protein
VHLVLIRSVNLKQVLLLPVVLLEVAPELRERELVLAQVVVLPERELLEQVVLQLAVYLLLQVLWVCPLLH